MPKKTRETLASQNGVQSLDSLHRLAMSGAGLTGLKNAMPTADDNELIWWLESNGYRVNGK